MPTRYYHDLKTRTVFEAPEAAADPKYGGPKKRRYDGCTVTVTVHRISGQNYMKPDGMWATPWTFVVQQRYDARDTTERALEMFRQLHMGHWGDEVTREDFERLRTVYEAEARANDPPVAAL